MNCTFGMVIALAALAQAGVVPNTPQAEPTATGGVTIQQIEAAWRSRQEAIRSFRIDCNGRLTVTRGAYLSPGEGKNPSNLTVPEADLEFDVALTYLTDGHYFRRSISSIFEINGDLKPYQTTWSFSDEGHRRVDLADVAPFPKAYLQRSDVRYASTDKNDLHDAALLLAIRPFHPLTEFGGTLDLLELLPRPEELRQRQCTIARLARRNSASKITMWLDSARDFLPIRQIRTLRDWTYFQCDVMECERASAGWIPSAWSFSTLRADGSLDTSMEVRVTTCEVNQPIAKEEFRLAIPVGAWVEDFETGEQYLLRKGGDKRIIYPEELGSGISYEELVTSEPGRRPKGVMRTHAVKWGVLAAIVLCAVLMVFRKSWKAAR